MATTLMQIRIDSELKKKADALFGDLGLDTSTAVRMFIKQALNANGLPFAVKKPKKSTEQLEAEAFYSPENVALIKESYEALKAGKGVARELIDA